MKRFFFLLAVFVAVMIPLEAAETDSQLYSRITSAYDAGFYPTVITLSDELVSCFPYSDYLRDVNVLKGRSLFQLSRYPEAAAQLAPYAAQDPDVSFLLGMAYWNIDDWSHAASSFYNTLKLVKEGFGYTSFTERTLLVYSAFSLNYSGRQDEAVAVLEHALVNFPMEEDFSPAVTLLFSIYSEQKSYGKIIWLYRQISGVIPCFSNEWQQYFRYHTAEAFVRNDSIEEAVRLYKVLMETADDEYAESSLRIAYKLADENGLKGECSPASILRWGEKCFPEGSLLLCDLWGDCALKTWNEGHQEEAYGWFIHLDDNCSKVIAESGINGARLSGYLELSGLYESDWLYSEGDAEGAAQLLRKRADPSGNCYMDYLLRLARYYADAGTDYLEPCLENAEKAIECYMKAIADGSSRVDEMRNLAAEAYMYVAYAKALNAVSVKDGSRSEAWKAVLEACRKRYEITGTYDYPGSIIYSEALMMTAGNLEPERQNAEKQALEIFQELSGRKEEMELSFISQWMKTLLLTGNYEQSLSLGGNVTGGMLAETDSKETGELLNLTGLSAAGSGYWSLAVQCLDENDPWTLYYKAYSYYRQSKTASAEPLFERFCRENPYHPMFRNACLYAATCALQNGTQENAIAYALNALKASRQQEQIVEATVLCAGIYNDMGSYDEAEKLLESLDKASMSISTRLLLSQTYADHAASIKKNSVVGSGAESSYLLMLSKADETLEKMAKWARTEPGLESLPEEVAYRRAELYYSAGEYETAADRYQSFREDYPDSTYKGQALFYNALSLRNDGKESEAILLFEECARSEKYDRSYVFSSLKQLVDLYENSREYGSALNVAELIKVKFPEEGGNIGIDAIIRTLTKILEGGDPAIAGLQALYENKGGSQTADGRKTGLSLAIALMNTESRREEGEAVLLAVVQDGENGSSSEDSWNIVGTACFQLAAYYRQTGRNNEAASYCISAARMLFDVDSQCEALYTAIDIFVSEAKLGDAKRVFAELLVRDSNEERIIKARGLIDTLSEDE